MTKFYIIDGSSMLSTAFYGNARALLMAKTEEEKELAISKLLHTKDGKFTNGILVMLRQFMTIIEKQKPEYVAFCFDKTRNTFRRKLYEEYKAKRSETPTPLKEQFVSMENILERLGFKVLFSDEYEADDFAASLVHKFEGPDIEVCVLSKDHDYEQLVSPYTRFYRTVQEDKVRPMYQAYYGVHGITPDMTDVPDRMIDYTAEVILGEEGVTPELIPDLLAIQGDPTDGIPGVKGVSSAAAPLLMEYHSLEGIYEAIEECEQNAKKEKALVAFWKEYLGISRSPLKPLKEYKDMAFLCRELATMKRDIPIEYSLEDFKVDINWDEYEKIVDEYELNSLKKKR